jgi:hypothetical protein
MADIAAAAHFELIAVGKEVDRFLEQVIRDYLSDRRVHQALRSIDTANAMLDAGHQDEASAKFGEALETAIRMGDRLTELKARLGLRRIGIKAPRGEGAACLDAIEADAYASRRSEIVMFLET